MKLFLVPFIFYTLLVLPDQVSAQLLIKIESGISNLELHNRSADNVKKEWARQKFIQAYRIGVEKKFLFNKFSISAGGAFSLIGATHVFLNKWRHLYAGLSIGTQYEIGKVNFGLRTTPSISLWSNWLTNFEFERTYNVDIEPNITLDISKRFQLSGGVSYGINSAIHFSDKIFYSHIAYLIGINYIINKR